MKTLRKAFIAIREAWSVRWLHKRGYGCGYATCTRPVCKRDRLERTLQKYQVHKSVMLGWSTLDRLQELPKATASSEEIAAFIAAIPDDL